MNPSRTSSLKSVQGTVLLLTIIALCLGLSIGHRINSTGTFSGLETALVSRVIDGDTVELLDGRRVRYLGIDTPEIGERYYEEASDRNRELVGGKTVELQCGNRDEDVYGRLLRYVYIEGVFVNAELVAEGYARAYIFDHEERYSRVLLQLEQYAKLKKQGIWGL